MNLPIPLAGGHEVDADQVVPSALEYRAVLPLADALRDHEQEVGDAQS